MSMYIAATILGICVLVYSASVFVDGASGIAKYFNLPSLLIGILIVGFGTSAPEIFVSIVASIDGASGIALGNAYGSNISNIALILGITAIIRPIYLNSSILRKELPLLTTITLISLYQIIDKRISRFDSAFLLIFFIGFVAWTCYSAFKKTHEKDDPFITQVEQVKLKQKPSSLYISFFKLILGLCFLILSSKSLVWGATNIAKILNVSDMIIGLTVVAIGTSLPELATSIIATVKGEHDLAFGNVIGSNIFNSLCVVGIAGTIKPFKISTEIITRDMAFMFFLTLSLFIIGYGFKGRKGRVNRFEGMLLLSSYLIYLYFLIIKAKGY